MNYAIKKILIVILAILGIAAAATVYSWLSSKAIGQNLIN